MRGHVPAALGHVLAILKNGGWLAPSPVPAQRPVDQILRAFDTHLDHNYGTDGESSQDGSRPTRGSCRSPVQDRQGPWSRGQIPAPACLRACPAPGNAIHCTHAPDGHQGTLRPPVGSFDPTRLAGLRARVRSPARGRRRAGGRGRSVQPRPGLPCRADLHQPAARRLLQPPVLIKLPAGEPLRAGPPPRRIQGAGLLAGVRSGPRRLPGGVHLRLGRPPERVLVLTASAGLPARAATAGPRSQGATPWWLRLEEVLGPVVLQATAAADIPHPEVGVDRAEDVALVARAVHPALHHGRRC